MKDEGAVEMTKPRRDISDERKGTNPIKLFRFFRRLDGAPFRSSFQFISWDAVFLWHK